MDNSTMTSSAQERKRKMDQGLDSNTDSPTYQEQSVAKCRQNKAFFRPWLDNEQNTEASPSAASPPRSAVSSPFRPTCASTPRQRHPQERSLLASLLSRRAEYQAQQWCRERISVLERQNLYYRQLLQQAVFQQSVAAPPNLLPQQQQQFLQQMALSQQMLVFGGRR